MGIDTNIHCLNDETKICPRASRNNKVVLIIGKSGAGKDSVAKQLLTINHIENDTEGCPCKKIQFSVPIQYTSRPKRTNEVEGKDYIFLKTPEEIDQLLNDKSIFDIRSYATLHPDSSSDLWYYATNTKTINLLSDTYLIVGPSTSPLDWVEKYIIHFGNRNVILLYIDTPNNDVFEYAMDRENRKDRDKRNYSELCRRYLDNVAEYEYMDEKIEEFVNQYHVKCIHYQNSRATPDEIFKRLHYIYDEIIGEIVR